LLKKTLFVDDISSGGNYHVGWFVGATSISRSRGCGKGAVFRDIFRHSDGLRSSCRIFLARSSSVLFLFGEPIYRFGRWRFHRSDFVISTVVMVDIAVHICCSCKLNGIRGHDADAAPLPRYPSTHSIHLHSKHAAMTISMNQVQSRFRSGRRFRRRECIGWRSRRGRRARLSLIVVLVVVNFFVVFVFLLADHGHQRIALRHAQAGQAIFFPHAGGGATASHDFSFHVATSIIVIIVISGNSDTRRRIAIASCRPATIRRSSSGRIHQRQLQIQSTGKVPLPLLLIDDVTRRRSSGKSGNSLGELMGAGRLISGGAAGEGGAFVAVVGRTGGCFGWVFVFAIAVDAAAVAGVDGRWASFGRHGRGYFCRVCWPDLDAGSVDSLFRLILLSLG